MGRALKAVAQQWCQESRHWALIEQHQGLSRKLSGHFAYYGITANARALSRFTTWSFRSGSSG
jgi:RNA-directed DNA polymerase